MNRKELSLAINRQIRSLGSMFSGYFQGDTKRQNPWKDYGFPETPVFFDFYMQYRRNGFARAGVQRAIEKCWQDNPWLLETEEVHDETPEESRIRDWAERLQLWSKLKEVDEKSRVGEYAALIFRFADNKLFREPVDRVPGGLEGLVEIIPVWQEQLKPSDWDSDERSPTYGHPKMYQFNEAAVWDSEQSHKTARSFDVHPSRVHIWSRDGTVFGQSVLEPGLNALITLQKIIGAGGEGFWKNAKSAPHLQIDKDANLANLAQMLGVPQDEIADAIGEQIEDWQTGMDNLLLTQGIDSKQMNVALPDPEQFIKGPLEEFSASVNTPVTELIGHMVGERASEQNQETWNQINMARRTGYVIPNIRRIVEKFTAFGVLKDIDWHLDWSDLTEATMEDKIDRAAKMADVNQKMLGTGEIVFTGAEMREVVGMEPLDEGDSMPDVEPEEERDQDPPEPQANKRTGRIVVNLHKGKRNAW